MPSLSLAPLSYLLESAGSHSVIALPNVLPIPPYPPCPPYPPPSPIPTPIPLSHFTSTLGPTYPTPNAFPLFGGRLLLCGISGPWESKLGGTVAAALWWGCKAPCAPLILFGNTGYAGVIGDAFIAASGGVKPMAWSIENGIVTDKPPPPLPRSLNHGGGSRSVGPGRAMWGSLIQLEEERIIWCKRLVRDVLREGSSCWSAVVHRGKMLEQTPVRQE
ncbi:hypothetical protein C8J55DRAFT_492957 [Lentinula edodes]|uniref:Uncharacterized protein n=1 Tax=Lentinula lateritia TaxID=40482 RepID=A0A9W8ZU45_9AGAR|nr:hypothetical protein C8J55DRAFT_492957 [Lentinula edodes]